MRIFVAGGIGVVGAMPYVGNLLDADDGHEAGDEAAPEVIDRLGAGSIRPPAVAGR